jgi:uncharacterized hydrophobic protein (TIGR00341 family)
VADILGQLSIIASWQQKALGDLTLVSVLAQADQTEAIIQALEERFANDKEFRAILVEVKATSPALEIASGDGANARLKDDDETPSPERIACLELTEKLSGAAKISKTYILSVLLSAIVAAVGLVRNNVAIIIGAMVIAPLLTPNMALALSTTLGNAKLARNALKTNLLGIAMALGLAAAIGFGIKIDPLLSEIAGRAELGYSDIVLALAAGSAGALAFTSGVSAALVGVMVAVAILPPLVAAGLLLGSGYPAMGIKALLLTFANIICVNLSGVGLFLLQGIRPRFFWEATRARHMVKVSVSIWIGLLALLIGVIYLNQRFIRF